MGHTFANIEEARECMAYWKQTLSLQPWDIDLQICRRDDMGDTGIQGRCYWTEKNRQATIKLLDPTDFPTRHRHFDQDHEVTLVHELLHLHGAGFDDFEVDKVQDIAWEQAIHHISTALVIGRRREYRLQVANWAARQVPLESRVGEWDLRFLDAGSNP